MSLFGWLRKNNNYDLPLLKYTSDLFPNIDLSKSIVIACQHVLGTTVTLFEELFKKGLRPENLYLIGKCYSTNQIAYKQLRSRKVNISPLAFKFNSHLSFDEQFQIYIDQFLKEIQSNINTADFDKVIVLDDGGSLILYADDFFDNVDNFVGIEQTSSGYEKIKNTNLSFPVVNVARSKAKLEIESPLISELVVEKLKIIFKNYRVDNPKILVIGQGYIGKSIAAILKKDYSVNGCDILSEKCDFQGNFKIYLKQFDVIVGATGKHSLQPGDFKELKKGVLLASASSSDREFSATYLRQLKSKTNNCHQDFKIKDTILINGGFPINFDGGYHSLEPKKIQLTRALLLLGVLQASNTSSSPGIIDLDIEKQEMIMKEFSKTCPDGAIKVEKK